MFQLKWLDQCQSCKNNNYKTLKELRGLERIPYKEYYSHNSFSVIKCELCGMIIHKESKNVELPYQETICEELKHGNNYPI